MRPDRVVVIRSDRRQRVAYRVSEQCGTVGSRSQIGRVLHVVWKGDGDHVPAKRVARAESRFAARLIGVNDHV